MPCLVLIIFSGVPSNRAGVVVSIFKLLAAGVSRPIDTAARVHILAPDNTGVCLDDEYTTTDSGH